MANKNDCSQEMRVIFEQVLNTYPKNRGLVSSCKECIKKCEKKFSFSSSKNMGNFSNVCDWLTIYGDTETAMKLIAFTHPLKFEHKYSLWEIIPSIWALEVYILRKRGDTQGVIERMKALDESTLIPNPAYNVTKESYREEFGGSIKYEEKMYKKEIDTAIATKKKKTALEYMKYAWHNMIKFGESGFYSDFVKNKSEIEENLIKYADILSERVAFPAPDTVKIEV